MADPVPANFERKQYVDVPAGDLDNFIARLKRRGAVNVASARQDDGGYTVTADLPA